VHYLLQDCYLALKFGKRPLIGHAHGSDLRSVLHHPIWSRIVRHNLKECDKVIVSTPDILDIARKYRNDVEYLPNPVDTELFYPKPPLKNDKKKRVLIASDFNWNVKGTDMAIKALAEIKEEVNVSVIAHGVDLHKTLAFASSLGLKLTILPRVIHKRLNKYYWNADVVIDRFKMGSLGVVSLEAIACGRPLIAHVSSNFSEYEDFPLKDVNTVDAIVETVKDASQDLWSVEYKYLTKHHDTSKLVQRLIDIYSCTLKKRSK
jgi:glycosyltransferase involved in cell wall biosynthesis